MSNPEQKTIEDGDVVTMHYTLTLNDGETVDSSRGSDPLAYLHGAQGIVPGLEKQLTGKEAGASFKAVVSPEEGYGPRVDEAVQQVPKTALPEDLKIEVGMQLEATGPDGSNLVVNVTEVREEDITVDMNHPLAGETLNFDIEVVEVRPATDEEKSHGHVHGAGGHDH